jgi:hypothetical protein
MTVISPGEEAGPRSYWSVAVILVLVAFGLLFAQTAGYGMLGHDTYPIIATSRVQGPGDFVGNFTERLMDGRYPGAFYRPLLNLTFALDYAVWGLAPIGYQLTNLALFAGCALILFGLAGRLSGGAARVAPYAALVAFLLHPTHFEVIPVPARRPELLCCLFMAFSLWLQLSPRAMRSVRAPILPAVATLLAIASKESGFVLPLLTFVVVLLYAEERSPRGKLRRAVRSLGPHVVVVAVMLSLRLLVLGGIGGHRAVSPGESVTSVPRYLTSIAREMILPQPQMRESLAAPLLLLGLTFGLIGTGVLLSLKGPQSRSGRVRQIRSARVLAVALTWIVALGATYAAAGWIGPWYFLLPVAGWSLLVGGVAERFAELAQRRGEPVRWAASFSLLCVVLLLAWHASLSPIVHRYDEWQRATEVSRRFLDQSRLSIEQAQPGSVVQAPPLPFWVQPARDSPTIFGGAILADYSVQAWAELALPGQPVVVVGPGADQASPGRITLAITHRLPGY